ncbi:hypothetical protein CEXT_750481 [Caerostris extrusa]|uniref:Uncharacterized protein n=1 Tax=Caerostris extrusa TaxID=172846 RepID=A0AAV4TNS5_CAEEX|nr:hypothetical protein CEXT_750481 [Caerostris extrusa]
MKLSSRCCSDPRSAKVVSDHELIGGNRVDRSWIERQTRKETKLSQPQPWIKTPAEDKKGALFGSDKNLRRETPNGIRKRFRGWGGIKLSDKESFYEQWHADSGRKE